MSPWRAIDGGVLLVVRVTPRGGRDAFDGVDVMSDGREVLKIRVRAAPTDGEANEAVVKLLAATLGIRRSDIEVTAGATARVKQIVLHGDAQHLTTVLTERAGKPKQKRDSE